MNACPVSGADLQLVRAVSGAGLEAALTLAVKPLGKDGETSFDASSNLDRGNEILAGVPEWAATASRLVSGAR